MRPYLRSLDLTAAGFLLAVILGAFAVPIFGDIRGTAFSTAAIVLLLLVALGCAFLLWRDRDPA